jgi:hypothetical protein
MNDAFMFKISLDPSLAKRGGGSSGATFPFGKAGTREIFCPNALLENDAGTI